MSWWLVSTQEALQATLQSLLTKMMIRIKWCFSKFELSECWNSKMMFFKKNTYLGVPGIFQWGNASCISVLPKSLKNDDSHKMMFFKIWALRMLKFKNDVFQKIIYLEVPGIFQWGNASCVSLLRKSLKNDDSHKMMFSKIWPLRMLKSLKMMHHFSE